MPTREPAWSEARGIASIIAAILLIPFAVLLLWEFATGFGRWSNGWMEGLSYALGAILMLALSVLLLQGRSRDPLFYGCVAMVLAIIGLWFVRWTWWLLATGSEIGPLPWIVGLPFAAGGMLSFALAAVLIRRAWRSRRM
jgi:hypothetical protein